MRILLWNCCKGINQKKQIDYFKSFNCDLAVLPELKESNIDTLSASSSVWITNNHNSPKPNGLGVLAFNDIQIESLPRDDDMEIFIPLKIKTKNINFTLLAVWNFYWACKQGRFKNVNGEECLEWSAMRYYKTIFNDPCLSIGDWNFGPTFSQKEFVRLCDMFGSSGMKSLYHEYNDLPVTETKNFTFKSSMQTYHHLDHMFGSKYFCRNMKSFNVDTLENAVLSDHAPMILDI